MTETPEVTAALDRSLTGPLEALRGYADNIQDQCDELADALRDTLAIDALPALLREDSPAGDALRERLGLRLDISRIWVSEDGRMTSTGPWPGSSPQETRSLHDIEPTTTGPS